jgi:hypothetical protein
MANGAKSLAAVDAADRLADLVMRIANVTQKEMDPT